MAVKVLPKELSKKIAAGEVIERPASVVKELIENALDAGAKRINISIKGGGVGEIKVVDDGIGMSRSDITLIPVRFTTSKISNEEDLERIRTLGFRGEALASMCTVSKMLVASRQKHQSEGCMMSFEGGVPVKKERVVMDVGTIVSVKDLFYNTPARRKFLRSKQSETKAIIDTTIPYLLAYPHVSFKLIVEGKIVLNTEEESLQKRVKNVVPDEWVDNPLEVFYSDDDITISGLIARPEKVNSFRTQQYFFVNNRPVQSKIFKQAISLAYESTAKRGTPGCVLIISLPFEQVDVNVHPKKAEVRFRDNQSVFRNMVLGIKKALAKSKDEKWGVWGVVKEPVFRYSEKKKRIKEAIAFTKALIDIGKQSVKTTEGSVIDSKVAFYWDKNFPVVQIANAYIVTQDRESIVIVDQHAAAERIVYERLLKEIKKGKVKSQVLAVPIDIELKATIEDELVFKRLEGLGIYAEPFGERIIRVRAFPAGIDQREIKSLILDLLQEPFEISATPLEKLAAIIACHHSIRFGEKLTQNACRRLLYNLSKCTHPFSCPHGRPTVYRIPFKKLDSMFER